MAENNTLHDCTGTEITISDLYEAIDSCLTNVQPSTSRNSSRKKPKKYQITLHSMMTRDLEEKNEAIKNLLNDFIVNHKDCKRKIEILQNEILEDDDTVSNLNAMIQECRNTKPPPLDLKEPINHLTEIWKSMFKYFDKTEVSQKKTYKKYKAKVNNVLRNENGIEKIRKIPRFPAHFAEVSQKKTYKKYKAKVNNVLRNENGIKKIRKIPRYPAHFAEEKEMTLLAPPPSTCHSDIDIENESNSLTENMKGEGDPLLVMSLKEKIKHLNIRIEKTIKNKGVFEYANVNLAQSNNDEAVVENYESDIEYEEIREACLLPSLLSPFDTSDDDVDNIPKIKDVTKYKESALGTSVLEKKNRNCKRKITVTKEMKSTEINNFEAVAHSTPMLRKKKRFAHRKTSGGESLEESTITATDDTQINLRSLKKSKLVTKEMKSTEINNFEAVAPSTPLLRKKKLNAHRKTSGLTTMKKHLKLEKKVTDASYTISSHIPTISNKESLPSVFNTQKKQGNIDFTQSESNHYSQALSESSDSDDDGNLIIHEDPTIHNDHYDRNLSKKESLLSVNTQKQENNIDFTQSESNQYSQAISESSDSDDDGNLIIDEDPTIHNDHYDRTLSKKESLLSVNTQKQENNIDFTQSESNQYSQAISESSDSDDDGNLIIDEDPTIHNDHYDRTLSKKESLLSVNTQKQENNIDFTQSESNQYSQSISESSGSVEGDKLMITEDPTIRNNHYDRSSHSLDNHNETKSTPKIEDQPSTSSGYGSKFIPSFYREREDITKESVPYQSVTKPTELGVEDIIQIEKSCDLTCTATRYIHSNVVEVSLRKNYETMVENTKWKNLQENLRNDIRKCDKLYYDIFYKRKQSIRLNVRQLKTCCLEAQAKSLLHIFPTEYDVTSKNPIFNPNNKHEATILLRKQYVIIRFISIHMIEHNGSHPFLKCLANEVFYYIRNFRDTRLKGSKCIQVTELLAALCNQYNLLDTAQAFVYDCLYWLKMLAFPLIFSMVKIYPQVFHHPEEHPDPLIKVFVHCILETPQTSHHTYLNYLLPLKRVLWSYYKYSKDSEKSLPLLTILLRELTEPGVLEAVLLLCKKQTYEWVYDYVVKYLLGFFMADKMKNENYAIASMRLIGMVMKPFPQVYSEDKVDTVISTLENLLFDPTGFVLLKEEIALALCHLIKFNQNKCITILVQWTPNEKRISENTMQIINNILKRECDPKCVESIIQNSNGREDITYESLSESEDV